MTRTEDRCECKVGRVLAEGGLDDLNETLRARRTREEVRPASLRDLVDYFNREVLRTALEDRGGTALDGEVENTYRPDGRRRQQPTRFRVRKRLEREGVDSDAVEERFVSHPTMGRHLGDCLGGRRSPERPGNGSRRSEADRDTRRVPERPRGAPDRALLPEDAQAVDDRYPAITEI